MRPKIQLKDSYCEVTLKSEYYLNQKVEFKEGIKHPLYSDKDYLIKDIRFNEDAKEFEYLLETKDFSRFWENQNDLRVPLEIADEMDFNNILTTMNSYSDNKPSSGLVSLLNLYSDNNLKKSEFESDIKNNQTDSCLEYNFN